MEPFLFSFCREDRVRTGSLPYPLTGQVNDKSLTHIFAILQSDFLDTTRVLTI